MKNGRGILTVTLLVGALSVPAVMAEQPSRCGGRGRGLHTPPLVQALDVDGDGVLSAAEIADAPAALLHLDTDGDGILSQEEIRPPWAGKGRRGPSESSKGGPGSDKCDGSGRRPPRSPILESLDADGDHALDASEIASSPSALLSLDANGDGVLTADEFRPQPPGGRGQGRGTGGGR